MNPVSEPAGINRQSATYVRLSEAMLLGQPLLSQKTNHCWLQKIAGGYRGCAFGGAVLAVGLAEVKDEAMRHHLITEPDSCTLTVGRIAWPWLTSTHLNRITEMYGGVLDGNMTMEQMCDVVDSWEPKPPTPPSKPWSRIREIVYDTANYITACF